MITINLKTLNDSFQSLLAVSRQVTAGPLKFRLLPVVRNAKQAIEDMRSSLAGIAAECGAEIKGEDQFEFKPDQTEEIKAFNHKASLFLKSETINFQTDKSRYLMSDVEKCEDPKNRTNVDDLDNLHWLFTNDLAEEDKPKSAAAASA